MISASSPCVAIFTKTTSTTRQPVSISRHYSSIAFLSFHHLQCLLCPKNFLSFHFIHNTQWRRQACPPSTKFQSGRRHPQHPENQSLTKSTSSPPPNPQIPPSHSPKNYPRPATKSAQSSANSQTIGYRIGYHVPVARDELSSAVS